MKEKETLRFWGKSDEELVGCFAGLSIYSWVFSFLFLGGEN